MDVFATVTSKGQVTLPKSVRDALGIETGDRLLFRVHTDRAVVARIADFLDLAASVPVPPEKRGVPWSRIRDSAWKASVRP
ncbi:MAG: AbrB/MazE/SpoVT family DNA-binding domain-containing protein [Actinomycetota bacterium]